MALTLTRATATGDVEIVSAAARPTFPNAETAIYELKSLIAVGENIKLKGARIVQAMRDQQLYRELGYDTWENFKPELLRLTSAIGWTAERTLDQYLAFADVYLDDLAFAPKLAMTATTHLNMLLRLADREKNGDLKADTERPDKLGALTFEGVAQTVAGLVALSKTEAADKGLSAEGTLEGLRGLGLPAEIIAEVFKSVAGQAPLLPPGGWQVADTKALIERITKKEQRKAVLTAMISREDEDGCVYISGLSIKLDDVEVGFIELDDKPFYGDAKEALLLLAKVQKEA